jgi:hypothetical protein
MAVVNELIRKEGNGTISFGNYNLDTKTKLADFEVNGDLYKVKTFKEITKLEKNGTFVYESVPGTAVHNFSVTEDKVEFSVEAMDEPQITVELESETEYTIYLDGLNAGKMKTNLGGKLVLSVEINKGSSAQVKIVKC